MEKKNNLGFGIAVLMANLLPVRELILLQIRVSVEKKMIIL